MPLPLNEIICGDCKKVMQGFPADSIDLTVTSPPYDNLRSYKGFTFDFEGIAQELYRVTKAGGIVVWVVGDATINGSETGTSFRQALYFKDVCGFNLHDTMIYHKHSPPLTHNRYEQHFEYMFVFCKGKPKTFNPITVKCRHAGSSPMGTFRHTGKETQKAHKQEPVKQYKIKSNVWEYKVGFQKTTKDSVAFDHPAIFPEQLAEDHIISWSNEGDIVFDPFIGSGTTAKMAATNNRHYIGIDISEEYCELARERVSHIQQKLVIESGGGIGR